MRGLQRLGMTALCVLALGAVSNAQISVGQQTLQAGQSCNVSINDPGRANQVITLVMEDNSDPDNPKTETVAVPLDSEGRATVAWTVQPWDEVTFREPNLGSANRPILP